MRHKSLSIRDMRLRSEFIIDRVTAENEKNKPPPEAVTLAYDNLKLLYLFEKAQRLVAKGFIDEWTDLIKEAESDFNPTKKETL